MKKINNLVLASCLLASFSVNATLTSMCTPPQPLGSHVSYIDKYSYQNKIGGATSNTFIKDVEQTLKGVSSSYLDVLNPSQFKFNWVCAGPCTFESEASFIRLQRGMNAKAPNIFKNSSKYINHSAQGQTSAETFISLRNEINFDGYYNANKIPKQFNVAIDQLLSRAKTSGISITQRDLASITDFNKLFDSRYTDVDTLIGALEVHTKKPLIVGLTGFDKKGGAVSGHSINVILEGSNPGSRIIIISNGEIVSHMDKSMLTKSTLAKALINTMDNKSKIASFEYDMFWE